MPAVDALGREAFLHLLTTQLKFQDPLKPMESTEFISQLAQFRELETALETNKTLNTLVQGTAATNNLNAAGLIGRRVEVRGGGGFHVAGETETIAYNLKKDASAVFIHVLDAAGNAVRTLPLGQQKGGANTIQWDGNDNDGNPLPEGQYTYLGTAKDAKDQLVPVSVHTQGEITGVSYENGAPLITVNGSTVPLSDIIKVLK